jgi:hypothetical protein
MPGEHDASLDNGKAFKEFFGQTHYTFDHKGAFHRRRQCPIPPPLGDEQLEWLRAIL